MFQKNCIHLLQKLVDLNYKVLLETSGSLSIEDVPKEVINIIDFKGPSSNMEKKNYWQNVDFLKDKDEVKFVIADKQDYKWSKNIIEKYKLTQKCNVLMSPSYKKIKPIDISKWILDDGLDVRFQIQLHKIIWDEKSRGV